jgi:hypothetical protein
MAQCDAYYFATVRPLGTGAYLAFFSAAPFENDALASFSHSRVGMANTALGDGVTLDSSHSEVRVGMAHTLILMGVRGVMKHRADVTRRAQNGATGVRSSMFLKEKVVVKYLVCVLIERRASVHH